jgi:hypothetical protein
MGFSRHSSDIGLAGVTGKRIKASFGFFTPERGFSSRALVQLLS